MFVDDSVEVAVRSARKEYSLRVEKLMNDDEFECIRDHVKTPVAVIGSIKALHGLYTREVYDPFLKRLRRVIGDVRNRMNVSTRLMTFPYDWTRSNVEAASRLYNTLSKLVDEYDDIILVAHSMGGLICRYMLENILREERPVTDVKSKLRETLAGKIVLFYGVGVPHYGCMKSLHQLVNPNEEIFGRVCRELPSLYEMIPFSDVNNGGKRQQWRRCRSDVFLHRNDEGEEILIDPDFWRLNAGQTSFNHLPSCEQQTSSIVDELVNEYPVLRDSEYRLRSGLAFHQSLNTNLKPNGCVYVLVNATGVVSPSQIDSRGKLVNECLHGDGVVCSVVPPPPSPPNRKRHGGMFLKSLLRPPHNYRKTQRTAADESSVRLSRDDNVYKNSVHISMLNNVDLAAPIEGVIAERFRRCGDWNVESFLFNGGPSRSRGLFNRIRTRLGSIVFSTRWRRGTSRTAADTQPAVLSSRVLKSGAYKVTVINNASTDRCLVTFDKAADTTESGGGEISLSVSREAARRKRQIADHPEHLSVRISTRGYGTAWNELGVVLSGQYEIISLVNN